MICRDNLAESTSMENYTAKKDEIFVFKNLEAETNLKWNSLVSLTGNGVLQVKAIGGKGEKTKCGVILWMVVKVGGYQRIHSMGGGGNEHCF